MAASLKRGGRFRRPHARLFPFQATFNATRVYCRMPVFNAASKTDRCCTVDACPEHRRPAMAGEASRNRAVAGTLWVGGVC